MGISLPIGSHLDESQARRTTRQAEDYFSQAGQRAGNEFSRQVNQGLGRVDTGKARVQAAALERAYDKAADAAGRLRIEEAKLEAVQASGTATHAQLITHSERAERARRAEARAVREAASAYREIVQAGSGLTSIGRAASESAGGVARLGAESGSLLRILGPAGIATAVNGAIEVIGTLGSAAMQTSGVLGLLPGVALAVGAGFGTMKIATMGFSDALDSVGKSLQDFKNPKAFAEDQKAFAESIQSLSPNAQQAALAINAMVPAFYDLKNATQNALFDGVGQELNRLASTYLPSIQTMLSSIAGSFNSMFKGVANQLMTPETQTQLQQMMQNISQAFQNLAPAMGPVTRAFAELANVSSSFLPGLATSIANVATQFSNFITNAAQSGQLRQWIQDGIDAVKELGSTIPPLIDGIKTLFGKDGKEAVDTVKDSVLLLAGTFKLLKGDVEGFKDVWPSFGDAVVKVFNDINSTINNLLIAPLNFAIDALNKIGAGIPKIPTIGMGTTLPPGSSGGGSPGFSGGGGNFGPSATVAPSAGVGSIPGLRLATGTSAWWPTVPNYPNGGYTVPGLPADDAKGKKQPLPTVPIGNNDPMSLLQGFPATASLYSVAGTVLDNQQKVAQAKSDLNTLEKANVRDEDAILAKRNELARAQREEHESELRLNEAKQQAVQQSLKGMQTAQGDLQQLGAQIDKDFGVSKGLGGIVENAVKALGNILAAPFLQALGFVAKANPNEGSGLVGIAAANGAFGQQYTPGVIAASQASGLTAGGLPGYLPASASGGFAGGYASDAALLANVPAGHYAQTQAADLTKGLGDCSSAIEDLINIMDGRPTGGRSMSTGNEAEWLQSRGFLPGMGGPGDFRVGFNSGHTQATLPGGTNFNWGSDASAQARGMDGSQGAYDPAFTSHFYRPTTASAPITPSIPPAVVAPAGGPGGLPFSWPSGGPAAAGVPGGGAPLYPGVGFPQALPGVSPLGTVSPVMGGGTAYPSQGGNSGNLLGGMAMDGIMAATSGLDALAPGAGAAAKIGIQVLNRTIGYAAQNAGIAASGLMETFSVGDNPKGSLGAGWLGKLAGGFAGAGMALPNIAGQKAPQQGQGNQQQQQPAGNTTNNINVTSREGASGQEHGEQIAAEQSRMYAPAGRQ
ncbi:hypothetical protein [Mycolicibacterium phocaicum]|uniref:hypothetical protein n=1 Tax=Mycolicibacterium phocaicum TaxID=319706 RepID=UPI001CF96243|nr:hypothetical protein [Mycolicibacterium phocaicum]UCZ58644.1 hypothetical protein LHJ73_17875 [Mycolicibacterium phocaicum]